MGCVKNVIYDIYKNGVPPIQRDQIDELIYENGVHKNLRLI